MALQLVLVQFALAESRDEQFPDAGGIASSHRVTAPVPAVEIADHRDAHGVRRPDREAHALHAFVTGQLRAQAGGQLAVVAFGEQVQVEFAEQRPEGIGVFAFLHAVRPVHAQAVARRQALQVALEQAAAGVALLQFGECRAVFVEQLDALRAGQVGTQHAAFAAGVALRAEEGEGIALQAALQLVQLQLPAFAFGHRFAHRFLPFRRCSVSSARPARGTSSQSGR